MTTDILILAAVGTVILAAVAVYMVKTLRRKK